MRVAEADYFFSIFYFYCFVTSFISFFEALDEATPLRTHVLYLYTQKNGRDCLESAAGG